MEALTYFVSYAREDSEAVLKLATELRAAGAQLWLDQLDIVAGQRWDHAVEEGLVTCQGLIVVLSPDAVASDNVMDEVSYALEEGKPVIPLLLRPCTIPFRLRRVHYINLTANYETGFSQLLRALRINQPLPSSAPAAPQEEPFVRDVSEERRQREETEAAQRRAEEERRQREETEAAQRRAEEERRQREETEAAQRRAEEERRQREEAEAARRRAEEERREWEAAEEYNLSLDQAAQAINVTRATLRDYIKSGRVKTNLNGTIKAVELLRAGFIIRTLPRREEAEAAWRRAEEERRQREEAEGHNLSLDQAAQAISVTRAILRDYIKSGRGREEAEAARRRAEEERRQREEAEGHNLSLDQAAQAISVTRATLRDYIKSGRVETNPDGTIEAVELLRAGFIIRTLPRRGEEEVGSE